MFHFAFEIRTVKKNLQSVLQKLGIFTLIKNMNINGKKRKMTNKKQKTESYAMVVAEITNMKDKLYDA
ncbi:MAG: hypothetical protein C0410_15445, partial [Anaerolinea sp.]|nr:hypothetical protein [Anaerolinea sp.]